jgi:hypothetical protein
MRFGCSERCCSSAAILSANRGEGRTKFVRSLEASGRPGMSPERAVKLLKLGRAALEYIEDCGASVCSFGDDDTHSGDE